MVLDPVEGLFQQYEDLIKYAANLYSKHRAVEFDDMFQNGCLMMLNFFDNRASTKDVHVHNTFKKSLFLWMMRTSQLLIKKSQPRGGTMVRLGSWRDEEERSDDSSINIDRMLVTFDACVLMEMYTKELIAELRRMLVGLDLTIFNVMVDFSKNPRKCGSMVRELEHDTGIPSKDIYNRFQKIRSVVKRVISRSA